MFDPKGEKEGRKFQTNFKDVVLYLFILRYGS